jgi:hypothetical protein
MPIDPSLYPDNWKELALKVKESQNWQCQCCGKKCYEPGERPDNLTRSEWVRFVPTKSSLEEGCRASVK